MPIITWKNDHSVNVEEIDSQHQQLINLINNLHSSVEECIDKKELEKLLIELVDFTRTHFATEETLMKAHNYPDLINHHKEHRELLQHLDNLVNAVLKGKYPTFYSDYDISSDWAMLHILDADKKLGDFLNSNNIY